MANLDLSKSMLIPKMQDMNSAPKLLTSVIGDYEQDNMAIHPREEDTEKNGYGVADELKRKKLQEICASKLKGFFETVQKQHPESRLELREVNGNWRVWCGACKKLLRPDKSGKAIHNIQRQHFTSARHIKKLRLMLQAEEEVPESQRRSTADKGSENSQ